MADIAICDANVQEGVDVLQEMVNELKSADKAERNRRVKDLEAQREKVKKLLKQFRLELKYVEDKAEYEEKLQDYDDTFTELAREVRAITNETDYAELMEGAESKTQDKSSWGNEEYANDIEKVAGANKEHLESAHAMAVEAREVMTEVGANMQGQTEQIKRTTEEVQGIDDSLNRVNKLIRAFGKRVFTDRIIRGFTLLLLLGVVAIVVIATVFPDQTTFDVPDEAKPPVDDATDAANSAKDQAGS